MISLYVITSGLVCAFLFVRLYERFWGPRPRIPNAHWSSNLSSFWILWIRYSSREIATIHKAHRKFGPVVRLAPNEISVDCVKGGIQTIYAGGFEKHRWYSDMFYNYG
jgi:hypothetical protein